jgi:hypothetical protein
MRGDDEILALQRRASPDGRRVLWGGEAYDRENDAPRDRELTMADPRWPKRGTLGLIDVESGKGTFQLAWRGRTLPCRYVDLTVRTEDTVLTKSIYTNTESHNLS